MNRPAGDTGPEREKDRRIHGSEGVFLVRIHEIPQDQSARDVAAVCADGAGLVSVGVRDLSPQDINSQEQLVGGGSYSSSLAASPGR